MEFTFNVTPKRLALLQSQEFDRIKNKEAMFEGNPIIDSNKMETYAKWIADQYLNPNKLRNADPMSVYDYVYFSLTENKYIIDSNPNTALDPTEFSPSRIEIENNNDRVFNLPELDLVLKKKEIKLIDSDKEVIKNEFNYTKWLYAGILYYMICNGYVLDENYDRKPSITRESHIENGVVTDEFNVYLLNFPQIVKLFAIARKTNLTYLNEFSRFIDSLNDVTKDDAAFVSVIEQTSNNTEESYLTLYGHPLYAFEASNSIQERLYNLDKPKDLNCTKSMDPYMAYITLAASPYENKDLLIEINTESGSIIALEKTSNHISLTNRTLKNYNELKTKLDIESALSKDLFLEKFNQFMESQ